MKNQKIKSLYIHIPFCKHICSYCDFCKMYYNQELVDKYLLALQKEIENTYKGETLETIYIGGGTPSCLNEKQIDKLFNVLNNVKISPTVEFTFEMNVSDINEKLLLFLKEHHVNRISVGIETINKKFQSLIERENTKEEVYYKINLAKKFFNNINVDFMYAFPKESLEELQNDLNFFHILDVPHISIYSLILEPNTKLYIKNTKSIDEDLESNMYFYIIDYLNKLGFKHYEISNFAKEGYESRHNLTYWNNDFYYGVGLGASGYIDKVRYTNTRSINKYLMGNYRMEEEVITKDIDMENEMILGLRKIDGVNKKDFTSKFGLDMEKVFNVNKLLEDGMLSEVNGNIFIPKDKLYLSNSILVNFIKNG